MKSIHTLLRIAAALSLACLAGLAYSAPSTITVSACTDGTFNTDPNNPEVLNCPTTTTSLSLFGDNSCKNQWLWNASTGQLTCGTPSCSITGVPASGAPVNTPVTLGVSCNFTPVNYAWSTTSSAPICATTTGSTCTVTSATVQSIPISVTVNPNLSGGCDTGTNCSQATANVSFTAVSSTGGIPSSCGYTYYSAGNPTQLPATLSVIGQTLSSPTARASWFPALGGSNMFMVQINVPKGTASGTHTFSYAEYSGPPTSRLVYVSSTPCFANAKLVMVGVSGSITLKVNATTSGYSKNALNMMPGDTWYVMVVDYAQDLTRGSATFGLPVKTTCPGGGCSALVNVI